MTARTAVSCVVMRGGTSKGVVVRREELSDEPDRRERQVLSLFGSPHPYQVDGLGGGSAATNKFVMIGESTKPGADVDYTFGQVSVTEPRVDFTGTCGNMSAAGALFAAQEGYLGDSDGDGERTVVLHNTNTGGLITAVLASARPGGDEQHVLLDYSDMAQEPFVDGLLRSELVLPDGEVVEASLSNIGNPVVFVRASSLGIEGDEPPAELDADAGYVARVEAIREAGRAAMLKSGVPGVENPAGRLPMLAAVSRARVAADICVRLRVVGRTHAALAGSGAISTAAFMLAEGTIPAEYGPAEDRRRIRIEHPAGVMDVVTRRATDGTFSRLALERTARRLMEGRAYV